MANYNGNSHYNSASKSNTITINKKTTSLKGSDLTKFYGDTTPYTVQLLDNQNKPLSNMQITINVNGVNYYPKTNVVRLRFFHIFFSYFLIQYF